VSGYLEDKKRGSSLSTHVFPVSEKLTYIKRREEIFAFRPHISINITKKVIVTPKPLISEKAL
jgi:hypothetical protein